jgi:hypothetical protein
MSYARYISQCKALAIAIKDVAYSSNSILTIATTIKSFNKDAACNWDVTAVGGSQLYEMFPYIIDLAILELRSNSRRGSYIDIVGILACAVLAIPDKPYCFIPIIINSNNIPDVISLFAIWRESLVDYSIKLNNLYCDCDMKAFKNFKAILLLLQNFARKVPDALRTTNKQLLQIIDIAQYRSSKGWVKLVLHNSPYRLYDNTNNNLMYLNSTMLEYSRVYIIGLIGDILEKGSSNILVQSDNIAFINLMLYIGERFNLNVSITPNLSPSATHLLKLLQSATKILLPAIINKTPYDEPPRLNEFPQWSYVPVPMRLLESSTEGISCTVGSPKCTQGKFRCIRGHGMCEECNAYHNPLTMSWGGMQLNIDKFVKKCYLCRSGRAIPPNVKLAGSVVGAGVKIFTDINSLSFEPTPHKHLYIFEVTQTGHNAIQGSFMNQTINIHNRNFPNATQKIYIHCSYMVFNHLLTTVGFALPPSKLTLTLYRLLDVTSLSFLTPQLSTTITVDLYIVPNSTFRK